jgi:hypothetical protein
MTRQEENFIEKCFANDLKSIKFLIKNRVDIAVSEYWGYRIAATNGFLELLSYLYSIDNNHSDIAKSGILAWTSVARKKNIIKYIIDLSDEYKNDSSAIQWTAANGDIEMMEILLGYFDEYNWIFVSAAKNGHLNMISFLLDNDIDKLDKEFSLTFNNAVLSRKKSVADLLLHRNAFSRNEINDGIWEKYEQL